MRDSSSPADGDGPWYRAKIWWPVERVPVRLEVVHPRKLLVLEWALLRVVAGLEDGLPTLEEVAEELGIGEAEFLRDTLREVVRLRALAPRDPGASWRDLPDLGFTTSGRALFRRGLIESEPAHLGEIFYFDALTDESCRAPREDAPATERPFPLTAPQPKARASVGLDRARDIIRALHGDLLRGDGELRSVEVRAEQGSSIVWKPVTIDVHLDEGGRLDLRGRDLSIAARALLAAVDPVAEGIVPSRAVTSTWAGREARNASAVVSLDDWRALVTHTIPVGDIETELLRLIGTARREILLHAGWTSSARVEERLLEAARSGVKVAVIGADQDRVLVLHEGSRPGVMARFATQDAQPRALIVDGHTGIMVASVTLEHGRRRPVIELAGELRDAPAAQTRSLLLATVDAERQQGASTHDAPSVRLGRVPDLEQAANAVMEDRHLRLDIARMAILDEARMFMGCVARCMQLAQWPERVRVLARVGMLAHGLVEGISEELCRQPARAAWRALLAEHRRLRAPRWALDMLASIAPEETEARELIDVTLLEFSDSIVADAEEACGRLVDLHRAVSARWNRSACETSATFSAARDALLMHEAVPLPLRVDVARQTLDAAGQTRWATAVLRTTQQRVGACDDDTKALLRAMKPLLDTATAARALLSGSAPLDEVVRVHGMLSDAGYRDDPGHWQSRLERILTPRLQDPGQTATTVKSLLELARRAPQLSSVGRTWAARVTSLLPRGADARAFAAWLRHVGVLRPLLDDLPARAAREVQGMLRALRTARAAEPPAWQEVERAWSGAGLERETLYQLVAEAAARPSGDGGKARSKRRKRR